MRSTNPANKTSCVSGHAGFTLMEVTVAFAIVVIACGGLLGSFIGHWRAVRHSSERAAAAISLGNAAERLRAAESAGTIEPAPFHMNYFDEVHQLHSFSELNADGGPIMLRPAGDPADSPSRHVLVRVSRPDLAGREADVSVVVAFE